MAYRDTSAINKNDAAIARAQRTLEAALGVPFSAGNQVTALRNGGEIFPAMLQVIETSVRRIDFLTFIYWSGQAALQFATALAHRARAGVSVNVLLDDVGATFIDRNALAIMKEAGVIVRWFRPKTRWRKLWQIDHRTHRKIMVIDGRVGFTGGVGIAEEWEGDARDPSEWRDNHFRVEGPAVHALQAAFLGNWLEAGEAIYPVLEDVPELTAPGKALVQVTRGVAAVGWSDIATLNEALLSLAKQRLRIASAYFVPDERNLALLKQATQRGVTVEVITPGQHHDHRVSQLAGEAEYSILLAAGVKLYAYHHTMYHCKTITVDGFLSCVGSPNFNQRSMRKDDEVAMTILDRDLTAALDADFDHDLERCERLDPEQWRRRGLLQRLNEKLIQPFKAQM